MLNETKILKGFMADIIFCKDYSCTVRRMRTITRAKEKEVQIVSRNVF